jgi:hypothetical protein
MHVPKPTELFEYFLIGVVVAVASYGGASVALGFAAFFVVPALAAPLVIALLRRGRGQEQEVGGLSPSRG